MNAEKKIDLKRRSVFILATKNNKTLIYYVKPEKSSYFLIKCTIIKRIYH